MAATKFLYNIGFFGDQLIFSNDIEDSKTVTLSCYNSFLSFYNLKIPIFKKVANSNNFASFCNP